tara:strand:- start:143 stop:979 length:837 start_codon:yes stop_codon:yes gene_type:complete
MISSGQDIQDNWPEYRCNPLYMPFASNLEDNFNFCIQNITNSISGNILQPITFSTSVLSDSLGSISSDIQGVRTMFDSVRNMVSNIFQSIFGVFLNLIISFQRIFIGIKDLFGKMIGVMVVLMYTLSGSIMAMDSAWKGPAGQLVQALGKCFHPETIIRLQNKAVKKIKNVQLGDILEGGSIVQGVMLFDNQTNKECLYSILNKETNENILVTGSHYIYDNMQHKFAQVKTISNVQKSLVQTDVLCCLTTSNNLIKIGNNTFWDYNDDVLSEKVHGSC